MITRKELALVLLTALATTGIAVLAQPAKSLMKSSVFDWNSIEAKSNKNGSSRKFFESPTATLELLECHVTTLNPGATNHPPNQHPEEEVIIVKEGTIEAFVNDRWQRVGPGSVIFNSSNALQAMRNVGDGPATYHVIMWHSSTTPKKTDRK